MPVSRISAELDDLIAIAVATISREGILLEANSGFIRLIHQDKVTAVHVDYFFVQPDFATLMNMPPAADGEVYRGLLTIGHYNLQTRTLHARIWRDDDTLKILAEHDIGELEQLNEIVLSLNQDYTKAQFEITQINLKLKQRGLELEQSLAQLEAANNRLQTTQKKLVEAEKMAALGVMVAGVAHEINSPLGVSLGSASLLEQQVKFIAQCFAERKMTQSDLNQFLHKAMLETSLLESNLERIGRLTDRFRQLAVGDQSAQKQRFNFSNCLHDVIASLTPGLLNQHVMVQVSCDSSLEIESFPNEWARIFTNLLLNSLQHAFKGRDDGQVCIEVLRNAETLKVDYRDNGIGLSTEVQAHIFDPFFTTDMQHGMGLGMHLVYNIITQQMRGNVVCDSSSGKGAHFYIEIPL